MSKALSLPVGASHASEMIKKRVVLSKTTKSPLIPGSQSTRDESNDVNGTRISQRTMLILNIRMENIEAVNLGTNIVAHSGRILFLGNDLGCFRG